MNFDIANMWAEVLKALAHPTRLQIVAELLKGTKCVTDIQDILPASQANISQHLTVLRHAGIVNFAQDGIAAKADPNLLRVALINLLGNAWKYTSNCVDAVIEFGEREIGGKPVYFVRDNGAGFDQADADKLFVPFQRLPGAVAFRGFGIGLATVERIVRRHEGKIWVEGEPDKGATFYFTLSADGV